MAKALNLKVYFYASTEADIENGTEKGQNGWYDPADGSIHLDLNAGDNGEGYVLLTASHELCHFIRDWSPEKFKVLTDFLVKEYGGGYHLAELATRQVEKARQNSRKLTYTQAVEEVFCDSFESMLTDERVIDKIEALRKQDTSIVRKIADFFRGVARKLAGYENARSSASYGLSFDIEKRFSEFADLFSEAAADAGENFGKARETDYDTYVESTAGIKEGTPMTQGQEIATSLRNNEKLMQNAIEFNNGAQFVDKAVMTSASKVRKRIQKYMMKNADKLKLPEDREGNTLFGNQSYGLSGENSTVCIRSLIMDRIVAMMEEELRRPLTINESIWASQNIGNYTDAPPCAYCYVSADRMAFNNALASAFDQKDIVYDSVDRGVGFEDTLDRCLNGAKKTQNAESRIRYWYNMALAGDVGLSRGDVAGINYSDEGVKASRDKLKTAAQKEEYDKVIAYARNASHAKKRVSYTAYNGNLLTLAQKNIDSLNRDYGFRMYSYSDFSPAFILENMQMVTDAAARGLKVLAYTKELDFVRIFAPTGMNINISVFAYTQDGAIAEDAMQGAAWKEAQELRKKYPNVGITMVATSDEIVNEVKTWDWVDVVLPYHSVFSGGSNVAKYYGFKDYKAVQADQRTEKGQKAKDIKPPVHQNDLIRYADALIAAKEAPRFPEQIEGFEDYRDGKITAAAFREKNLYYMKFVNETRQSAGETQVVQPVFNEKAAMESLKALEKRGGYDAPLGKDTSVEREIAEELAGKIRNGENGDKLDGKMYSGRNGKGNSYTVEGNKASFTGERIEELIKESDYGNGKTDSYISYINPMDFIRLTTTQPSAWFSQMNHDGAILGGEPYHKLDLEKLTNNRQTPYLSVEMSRGGAKVVGHEGRHRMLALAAYGIDRVPVRIIDRQNRYEAGKTTIDEITLRGQDFGGTYGKGRVTLSNVIPVLKENTAVIKETYGSSGAEIRFSLRSGAKADIHKAITEKKYRNEIVISDGTPSIITSQKGAKNLPLVVKPSHVRENVYTEAEAKKLGLPIGTDYHYHGLGENLYVSVLEELDNITEAYRGTKNAKNPDRRENYFILISKQKDKSGNTINVPIFINEVGIYNRVFSPVNKISTVFGRDSIREYISREVKNGNIVRIKNRSIKASEGNPTIGNAYSNDASIDSNPTTSTAESQEKNSLRNRSSVLDNATAEDIETEEEAKALLAYQELAQEIRGLEEESRAADAEAGTITDEDRKQEANEAEYRRMERLDSLYAERRKAENGKVLREMAKRISGEESAEGTAGRTKKALTAEEENRLLREKLAKAEAQMKKSGKKTLAEGDVLRLAASLIRETQAKGIYASDIYSDLSAIADEILNGDANENAEDMALKLSDRLISKAVETRDDNADTRKALITYLKGADITLPAENRGDIDPTVRKKNAWWLKASGVPVDEVWGHLNEEFPGLFGEDITNPADMITDITEALAALAPNRFNPYAGNESEARREIAGAIIGGLISEDVRQNLPTLKDRLTQALKENRKRNECR